MQKMCVFFIVIFFSFTLVSSEILVDGRDKFAYSALPSFMKGYELYSWQENEKWHFTLITGTRHIKSAEEIYSNDESINDVWVKLKAVGISEMKRLLSRIPDGEFIMWHDDRFISGKNDRMPPISYPGYGIINDIEMVCDQFGLMLDGFYSKRLCFDEIKM